MLVRYLTKYYHHLNGHDFTINVQESEKYWPRCLLQMPSNDNISTINYILISLTL